MKDREEINRFLVRRKFAISIFSEAASRPEVQAFVAELEALPLTELYSLYNRELNSASVEAELLEKLADESEFFSTASATANFEAWMGLKSWTIEETTALLLGKNPAVVSWTTICKIINSPFVRTYKALRQHLLRAKADGTIQDPDQPTRLVKFALEMQMDVPDPLLSLMSDAGEHSMDARAKDSMLKLIAGMAVSRYGYDPQALRSLTAGEIQADLAKLELNLSDDTIRKLLREAWQTTKPNK